MRSTDLQFDAVFCCGLLYHLPRPWELIEQIAQVTDSLFLSTHYAPDTQADTLRNGVRGMVYQEFGVADPLSGLSDESFWPTLDGLLAMLRARGFAETALMHHNMEHPHGPIVTLAASGSGTAERSSSALWLRRLLRRSKEHT